MSESENRMMEILRILDQQEKPTGSKIIAEELNNRGFNLGERAVRYHMKILDEKGYTRKIGYSGREITDLGKSRIERGLVYDEIDFTYTKFENYIYQTTFNPYTQMGNVIVNKSDVLDREALDVIKNAFQSGVAVSPNTQITKEKINGKEGYTVKNICGTTIDGVFLKNGIATQPQYGGIIEVKNYEPRRFKELISYKKTSITPLDAFIAKNMTSVVDVIEDGNGTIPANFRIIPSKTENKAKEIIEKLNQSNIGGVIAVGKKGENILGVPVPENFIGIAIVGGITPFCVAQELDYDVNIKLGEELEDYNNLKPIVNRTRPILRSVNPHKQYNKIPFFLSKSWNLIEEVDYDIETGNGNIIADISYVNKEDLDKSLDIFKKTYQDYPQDISPYYRIVEDNQNHDKVGIATVCSLSIDGILIKNGIMCKPKYGGLLEIDDSESFIELISYNGSSIDPHKIFIYKNLTSINKDITGARRILASIKEIPNIAREQSTEILSTLSSKDLSILKVGKPREMVYNAIVNNYKFGVVASSGLNAIAAIKEQGINIDIKAMESLMPLNEMDKF
jgi:repressor of nif and glnA expression